MTRYITRYDDARDRTDAVPSIASEKLKLPLYLFVNKFITRARGLNATVKTSARCALQSSKVAPDTEVIATARSGLPGWWRVN